MRQTIALLALLGASLFASPAVTADPPRSEQLAHLYEIDPYYPNRQYPKLITPQWVGEPDVEAVVVLAIDDMHDPEHYERYLRPILNRLKAIDGRAPVSIMTNQVNPEHPRLQQWLKEGLSIEVHTIGHPCPLLQKGDFDAAARAYHDCVDLMSKIPGNKPVAFRMPCCDSLNTPSPRFYAEIFNKTSPGGHFLSIDSSVFNVFTPDDPSLPRELVSDPDGRERFRKYIPFPSFVNTIEDYPYPYVIGTLCWEFPCIVPSDWEGQNIQKAKNPKTLEDMKAALDLVVLKQGVFNLVFHPHGWIKNEQVVDLIDHAVKKHGKKVKFLNFREAQERLDKNLLSGRPLRADNNHGRRPQLYDLDHDGYMDVVGDQVRTWDPSARKWMEQPASRFPALPTEIRISDKEGRDPGIRHVDLDEDGYADIVFSNDREYGIFLFDPDRKDWSRKVMSGKAGEPGALPKIVKDGKNNGFFVHSRHLWWQNEDTAQLPNHVDRRSFDDLLKDVPRRAKPPKAALDSIRVAPGFKVELAAGEPLVNDPIALDWGADGKLWVVEMGDYPLGVDGKGKPGGVVRFLEDTNGDGRYDKQTTFLDGLPFPTGVMPWRNGVIVASAPDIFYAEDRDGDGKADHREVLFTGFTEGNQQHRINGFELGLDGWVYGANGDSGGTIRSLKTGKTVSIQGRDFRFKPDTGEFETETGQTQYGRHRDDWGNWFGNSNPTWGWHFTLAESDLKRNPHYAPPDPRHTLEPDTRLHPVSRTVARFNDPEAANHVTSANSPTPYRDDLFGPHFSTSLFVSEPVHNLVHRMVLEPDGSTYRGVRAPGDAGREFLASSDNWFRPTQLKTGPDGALWVADMYRAVIEHPEWIPADIQKKIDLRAGSFEGRIYRVFPVDKTPRPIPRLDRLDTAGLVAALDSPSGWQRDTAQRLLLHRNDPAALEPLRALVRGTKRPQTRVQAVWTLSLLNGLDAATAATALEDKNPQVRRNVLKASENLLASDPKLAEAALGLVDDPDPRVRLQLALALGNWNDSRAGRALARIARRAPEDRWIRAAVLSSAVPHVATLLVELFRGGEEPPRGVVEPLVVLAGSVQDRAAIDSVIRAIGTPAGQGGSYASWQFAALRGLLEAAGRAKHPVELGRQPGLLKLIESARRVARDDSAGEAERLQAVNLLGFAAGTKPEDRDLLVDLLKPRQPIGLQQASIAALGRSADPKVPELLVRGWKTHSPQVRGAILDTVLSRKAWTASLLSSLEDTCVPPAEIDPAHRATLLAHRDDDIRKRAQAVFSHQAGGRQKVIDSYRPAPALKGDPSAGKAVFKRACATCHRLGDLGIEVGPNLGALNEKNPETLLVAILDPNRAFESRYANFTVATADGRVLSGLIASETASAVTLRRQEGKEDVLLRTEIEEMSASGQSLMPEGLEKDLTRRDMADLIAFLEGIGAPPKTFAGNHPGRVMPGPDGRIVLGAADAEIYGETLAFEEHYGNLGYWTAASDRAAWTFEVSQPDKYAVWLDWACPNESAGNVLELNLGSQQIHFQVSGTGTWDDYSLKKIGDLELSAGTHRLEARPAAAPRNAMLDLRRIELRPRKPAPKVTPTSSSSATTQPAAAELCSCCAAQPLEGD
jgi:putative membrane-bound dehydrogenase-like protein